MLTKKIGNLGEKIAERYLKKKGYQILEKNYINKFVSGPQKGEIDIIVKKNDTIIFVEVKSLIIKNEGGRASGIFPEERVDFLKQRKIMKTAQLWLMEKKLSLEKKWQTDVVAVEIDLNNKKAKIRHLKNAFFC